MLQLFRLRCGFSQFGLKNFANIQQNLSQHFIKKQVQSNSLYEYLVQNKTLFDEDKLKQTPRQILAQMIQFLGTHNGRKEHLEAQQLVLQTLRYFKTQYKFQIEDRYQTIIALSNLCLKDDDLVSDVTQQIGEDNKIDSKVLMSLMWSLQKINALKIGDLFKIMGDRFETFDFTLLTRLLWISTNEIIDENKVCKIIDLWLRQYEKNEYTLYNSKESYYIAQLMFNIYPELITQEVSFQNINAISFKKLGAIQKRYSKILPLYKMSRFMLDKHIQLKKSQGKSMTFLQRNYMQIANNMKNATDSFRSQNIITYSQIEHKQQSLFEKNIESILQTLNYPHKTNQILQFYEIDFLLENKIIIETNGFSHFVINTQQTNNIEETKNHKIKIKQQQNPTYTYYRHLNLMGYEKIIPLNYQTWQQIDPKQNQVIHLNNLIQEQIGQQK